MTHIFTTEDSLPHSTLDYPFALPSTLDMTPFNGKAIGLDNYRWFGFKDQIFFCPFDDSEMCISWNFRTGVTIQESTRPSANRMFDYATTEINGKFWVTGGELNPGGLTPKTDFLDETGHWQSGPNLPHETRYVEMFLHTYFMDGKAV